MLLERRSLRALTSAELLAWRELAAVAAEPNPFAEPAFVFPASRYLLPSAAQLVVAREDARGPWTACLPLVRTARRELWSVSLVVPGLGRPLIRPGTPREDVL